MEGKHRTKRRGSGIEFDSDDDDDDNEEAKRLRRRMSHKKRRIEGNDDLEELGKTLFCKYLALF